MENYNCIVVLGPTASGKTHLACQLAYHLNGEIISADSRQVYRHLDIGTGKDLDEYLVNGQKISHHLIDIVHPSEQFFLHQFIAELKKCFTQVLDQDRLPIVCGGTGLYLDALRKDFSLTQIPEDHLLREELESLSKEDLLNKLNSYPTAFTAHVDVNSKKRIVRGIEIAQHLHTHEQSPEKQQLPYKPFYIGITGDIAERRQLISQRFARRLESGLIAEVAALLDMGLSPERLILFGLEYKFVLSFLQQKISKDELYSRLETAIFQFAKRQMTWFRKMEKEGVKIHWVNRSVDAELLIKELRLR